MRSLVFADLTHTAQGIGAPTFPLGVSFVMAYARQELGDAFTYRLCKFPEELSEVLTRERPTVLCFSNYSWNFELAYAFARRAKALDPRVVTVFGGPNFPTLASEKAEFLAGRPAMDFYIELEGELGLVDLVQNLEEVGFDARRLKSEGRRMANTTYLEQGALISGEIARIVDVNRIPSPYLTGLLDPFFDQPLQPLLETTRGCPFSCTFCADGLTSKNKIARFDPERTRAEIRYIASHVKNVDELIITDLNFAMYTEDLRTADEIAQVKRETGWPLLISASAGKNRPERTIEVARILNGAWTLGASLQSTDPDVLKAIKRQNISREAYRDLVTYGNTMENSKTHSEIILGLPGDSRDKHFESLRFGVEQGVTHMRMFQAMLLRGTEMASGPTRAQYGLATQFRVIPGCVGIYDLMGEPTPVSEIEEIIVGNATLSFADYLECREMNLLVETFYNNALFEEVFALCRALEVSVYDCLLYTKGHPELRTGRIAAIIDGFLQQTGSDLFATFEEAKGFVLTPEVVGRYIDGELGINELLVHKTLLLGEFRDLCDLLFTAIRATLEVNGRLTPRVEAYLLELKTYTLLRKEDCVTDTEGERYASFRFDFEAIRAAGFKVDPDTLPLATQAGEWRFFHSEGQKRHIANQIKLYANTPTGMGRLLQRSNLKLIYRSVAPGPS
ncbi:MAG: radical SAM protein [Acidobacteria bacterium]|nr:radical SAM protein [Acidobacteriota bacterium]